jgi:hypothetical protein
MPGPTIFTPAINLGLKDKPPGEVDNLDALSYGKDPIENPLYFSVDRVAIGLPGSAVNGQAKPGSEEAAGDVYKTLPPSGSNQLFIDEEKLKLTPGFFGDDLDALELDSLPTPFTYFSIDKLSATNGFGTGNLADDILISIGNGSFGTFAPGSTMGIDDTDDLDALILWDVFEPGVLNPGIDMALFSLSTFSTSAFTFSGNSYQAGVKGSLSPADILLTDFSRSFSLWASANDIGLFPDDEVDALDTVPVPESSSSIALIALGTLGTGSALKRNLKQKFAEKQTDKTA